MISIVITAKGLDALPGKLKKFRLGVLARITKMLELSGEHIVGISREDYLSGPRPRKLGRRSGDLARSVGYKLRGNRVVIGSNLRYARIHEYGGVIRPKRAKALVFKTDSGWVTTGKVTIPERPFLRPALRDGKRGLLAIVRAQAQAALREAMA